MFKTSDFIFRRSVLGEAMVRAKPELASKMPLVREERLYIEGQRSHQIKPEITVPGAFGKNK